MKNAESTETTDKHPYEHLTDEGLLKHLDEIAARATPCDDVQISEYRNVKQGYVAYQFEGVRGGIQQEPADYEFYAALRTAWPRLRRALVANKGWK